MKKILVVAAHPDDEALGCGGTLMKSQKLGHELSLLFMTDGIGARDRVSQDDRKARHAGLEKALQLLQPKHSHALNFPDNQLDSLPLLQIVKEIESFIATAKPEIILTHFMNDLNVDHRVVAKAALTATRPGSKTFVPEIYGFEVPSSTELSVEKEGFAPNFYVDISQHLTEKTAFLKCYEEEMRPFPHARSFENISALSQLRGALCGVAHAEAFITYRCLRKDF